jgi:hypothetical protein
VYYYSCNRSLASYCNELALVVAEKANFWAEQSEAYAQCIVTAGLNNQHSHALYVLRCALFFLVLFHCEFFYYIRNIKLIFIVYQCEKF